MRLLLTLFVLVLLCPISHASLKMDREFDRFEIVEPIIVAEDDIQVRLAKLKKTLRGQHRKVLEQLERSRKEAERLKEELRTRLKRTK